MPKRNLPTLAVTFFLVGLLAVLAKAHTQDGSSTNTTTEPIVAWTCPVHREVHSDSEGTCPICQEILVRTLITRSWTCPLHSVITEKEAGRCPICQRSLIPITMEIGWICPMHQEIYEMHEGTCPICKMDLVRKDRARPHEDHNPKHGGIFFMAPDNWHHLEGTYLEPGIFRVYFYDNYSQPISPKDFEGRIVLGETYDSELREIRETESYPLDAITHQDSDVVYMEAQVDKKNLPAEIITKIKFETDGPEERFDFIFADYSVTTNNERLIENTTQTVGGEAQLFAEQTKAIPDDPSEIAFEIATRDLKIQLLIRRGRFNEIWVPALESKDLVLALNKHLSELESHQKQLLRIAMKDVVRAAYMLDWYGDLGNKQLVSEAYMLFGKAVRDIKSIYDLP